MPGVLSGPTTASVTFAPTLMVQPVQTQTPPMTPTHLEQMISAIPEVVYHYKPDEKLDECGGTLMNCQGKRLEIEFEENPGCAFVMFHNPLVVRYTVLVRFQWFSSWRNICGWDDG